MLEQAIADAAALREQAIKNAEQSVIEKYSQQIKEAVNQMLEAETPLARAENIVAEAEAELNEEAETMPASFGGSQEGATTTAPPAWDQRYEEMSVRFEALVDALPETDDGMVEIDLQELELSPEEEDAMEGPMDPTEDLLGDTEEVDTAVADKEVDDLLATLQESSDEEAEEDKQLQEILDMLDEKVTYENGDHVRPTGAFDVGSPNQDRAAIEREAYEALNNPEEEDSSEEDEVQEDPTLELYETIETLTKHNGQMLDVLQKLEQHLDEALLSNAKLLYQNRTLNDASLNERQKSKIVEAIANAESTKEAKQLFETLRATVGSTPNSNKNPKSLSESVNRKSNLSAMLNSRQNINESKPSADPFMEKMRKLAGIKK